MWTLAFCCSPDAQGAPPTAKSREVYFSAQDTRLPFWSHLPREKVRTKEGVCVFVCVCGGYSAPPAWCGGLTHFGLA